MATVRMSEAEVARDLHAVLEKVQHGLEVVVECDAGAPVFMKASPQTAPPRSIGEAIALAKAMEALHGDDILADEGFADDVQQGIDERRRPFDPPPWD